MKYTFLVNPTAGSGKSGSLGKLQTAIGRLELDAEVYVPGSAADLREHAARSQSDVVVAVGGDGTIHHVASGLLESEKALGIVPLGSGNDFRKSLGLPAGFDASLKILKDPRIAQVDIGEISVDNGSRMSFVNGVGVGFDALVAHNVATVRGFGGTARYVLAVLKTLRQYEPADLTIMIDSTTFAGRHLLVAIGNGTCAGGGFYLTPDARVSDGLLDVCRIEERSVVGILKLMTKVMKGTHASESGVTFDQARSISITSRNPFFVHADGEVVGRNVKEVRIGLAAKKIRAVVGEGYSG